MKILRVISAGMTVLFSVWAYYQINDVDSTIWVLAYAVVAILSLLFVFQVLPAIPAVIFAGLYLVWALILIPQIELQSSIFSAEAWIQTELLREAGGLIIMVLWLGVMAYALYRGQKGTNLR